MNKYMPNTTTLMLMAMLFTMAAAGIWGYQWTVEQIALVKLESAKAAAAEAKKSVAANFNLAFETRQVNVEKDVSFSADLLFTGSTVDVTEVNLVFAYDKAVIEPVEVTSGTVFRKDVEYSIDEDSGLIYVKLTADETIDHTNGVVASIEFTQIDDKQTGLTLQGLGGLAGQSASSVKYKDGSTKPIYAANLEIV